MDADEDVFVVRSLKRRKVADIRLINKIRPISKQSSSKSDLRSEKKNFRMKHPESNSKLKFHTNTANKVEIESQNRSRSILSKEKPETFMKTANTSETADDNLSQLPQHETELVDQTGKEKFGHYELQYENKKHNTGKSIRHDSAQDCGYIVETDSQNDTRTSLVSIANILSSVDENVNIELSKTTQIPMIKNEKVSKHISKSHCGQERCPFCQMPFKVLVGQSANWHTMECMDLPLKASSGSIDDSH